MDIAYTKSLSQAALLLKFRLVAKVYIVPSVHKFKCWTEIGREYRQNSPTLKSKYLLCATDRGSLPASNT